MLYSLLFIYTHSLDKYAGVGVNCLVWYIDSDWGCRVFRNGWSLIYPLLICGSWASCWLCLLFGYTEFRREFSDAVSPLKYPRNYIHLGPDQKTMTFSAYLKLVAIKNWNATTSPHLWLRKSHKFVTDISYITIRNLVSYLEPLLAHECLVSHDLSDTQ